jgi:hypothetical protein
MYLQSEIETYGWDRGYLSSYTQFERFVAIFVCLSFSGLPLNTYMNHWQKMKLSCDLCLFLLCGPELRSCVDRAGKTRRNLWSFPSFSWGLNCH